MDRRAFLTALWSAIADQDGARMEEAFTPDAQILWHCTNERFTLPEYIRANCEYPGDWRGQVERVEETAEGAVVCARVWLADESASFHCVALYRFRGDRIAQADEYWGDDGPPPEWRREKEIGRPI